MALFDDLITTPTLQSVRNTVVGLASAAGLRVTSWIRGGVGQQLVETISQAAYYYGVAAGQIIRGFASLDLATDPGDVDAYDSANASRTPGPGFLSFLGASNYGIARADETFGTGSVTLDNTGAGATSQTFGPGDLTFTWTVSPPSGTAPTYKNAADATIYTEAGGVVTLLAGATLTIPIVADEAGSRSNASTDQITLTTTLTGLSVSTSTSVVGADREAADTYRARCRAVAAGISPNGHADAYTLIATSAVENTAGDVYYLPPGQTVGVGYDPSTLAQTLVTDFAGEVSLGCTRVQVIGSSTTGAVTVWLADGDGGVTTGVKNKIRDLCAAVYFPLCTTPVFSPANAIPITVSGTGKLAKRAGRSATAAEAAIEDALTAYFAALPIGGLDQSAGAGVVYTRDIEAVAANAYAGLYDVQVSAPGGATTALSAGDVATLTIGTWTVSEV